MDQNRNARGSFLAGEGLFEQKIQGTELIGTDLDCCIIFPCGHLIVLDYTLFNELVLYAVNFSLLYLQNSTVDSWHWHAAFCYLSNHHVH